jgi:oxepin-CoA hydrolase/3-oxo-5,6-dehydrosuberyl-CoA semialdehyde dehydrogenase
VHPNLVAKSIPFTMEADSLNCCVLGDDVTPAQPEFALFIREVVREMTAKAGQKCTAIRRIIVPQAQVKAVSDALIARLQKVVVGDPAQEGVKMGALVNHEQRQDVQDNVNRLVAAGCDVLLGARPISAPPAPSSRQRCCTARSRTRPRRYTLLKRLVPSPP